MPENFYGGVRLYWKEASIKEFFLWVHRNFRASSVKSNVNFGFGKIMGLALQGGNFIKTLLHHELFQSILFKTASFPNIFRKESVVKSVYGRFAVYAL